MKQLFIMTISLFIMTSCQKNPEITPVTSDKNCSVKSISAGIADFSPNSSYYKVTFTGDKITQLTNSLTSQDKKTFIYNLSGFLLKSEVFYNYDNLGDTLVRSRIEYFYDTDSNIIKANSYYQEYSAGQSLGLKFSGIDSFFYTNGKVSQRKTYVPYGPNSYQGKVLINWNNDDIVSFIIYGQNGLINNTLNFTYDTLKENKIDINIKKINYNYADASNSMEAMRNSKHVLIKAVEQSRGNSINTYNYLTTFDNNNFIKSIQVNAYGNTYYINRFDYNCN